MPVSAGAAYLRAQGFNAVRVPLAVSALITNAANGDCMPPQLFAKPPDMEASAGGDSAQFEGITFLAAGGGSAEGFMRHNPTFVGLSYLGMVQAFVRALGDHGLLVLLDLHATTAGVWPDDGRVGPAPGAEHLKRAWTVLAHTFCDAQVYFNVFAADLKNEPHGM